MSNSLMRNLQSLHWASDIKVGKFKGKCFIDDEDCHKQLASAEAEREAIIKVETLIKDEALKLISDLKKIGQEEAAKIVYDRIFGED